MAKRATLGDFTSSKAGQVVPLNPAVAAPQQIEPERKVDNRRGQTLRLSATAWRQLKMIALNEDTSVHQLVVEAIDDLFRKKGKPTIATDEQPERRRS